MRHSAPRCATSNRSVVAFDEVRVLLGLEAGACFASVMLRLWISWMPTGAKTQTISVGSKSGVGRRLPCRLRFQNAWVDDRWSLPAGILRRTSEG
jgi:hypothetical protein